MSIDSMTLRKIAKLARIGVAEDEEEAFARELSSIVQWMDQLQSVDTTGVAPLASVSDTALPWREDVVTDGHCRDDVLRNAPMQDYGCFVVPKVME